MKDSLGLLAKKLTVNANMESAKMGNVLVNLVIPAINVISKNAETIVTSEVSVLKMDSANATKAGLEKTAHIDTSSMEN